MNRLRSSKRPGFTLVELLVVIAIGGISAAAWNRPAKADGAPPTPTAPSGAPAGAPRQPTGPKVRRDLGGGVRIEFVRIPAGEFTMGTPASEAGRNNDEGPQHRVRITKPFYLGTHKVTQEQWEAVMGGNPSCFKGPRHPVDSVSWDDCQAFISKLNRKFAASGDTFSLPTEAQWEYACRAGSTSRFCFGDDESGLGDYAWYSRNSGGETHPVGEKEPNAWGLYDVYGDVWEWCADWFGGYGNSPIADPTGPPDALNRVGRGGGWFHDARDCRSGRRGNIVPGRRDNFLGLRVVLVLAADARAGAGEPPLPSAPPEAVQRWKDLRFGMFISWGPISLKGTEIGWSRNPGPGGDSTGTVPAAEYDNLYKRFNPARFNAKEWAETARSAGMRYVVLVAKHIDGFCLFDSKLTDYKITSPQSPFRRDIVKDLSDACREAGLKFGVYYSPFDLHHPDFAANRARYRGYVRGQVCELLGNYGPISVMWFDFGSVGSSGSPTLFPLIRQLQPDILISNRCGLPGDFDTPEQTIGAFRTDRPWESCMTVSRRDQWSWGGSDDGVKPLADCLNMLIRCAGGDGNMVLNVGPMPDGQIAPEQIGRLKEIGRWLAKYGESIYGTRGGPYRPAPSLVSTRRENTVYLHILHGREETLLLHALSAKVLSATLLTGGEVRVVQNDTRLALTVAAKDCREIDTIVKLQLDRPAGRIVPLSAFADD